LWAAAVAVWLVLSPDSFCPRGLAVLWAVVAIVFGIGIVELSERSKPGSSVHEAEER
jgi:hypothetical protein